MAVSGFPRRQEDPKIERLLERARQQAQLANQIGSPEMYSAEAYGGNFPIGTLTAQILGGARAGVAEREAQKRQEMSDVALNLLGSIEPNSQFDYNNRTIYTDDKGNFLERTPLADILKGPPEMVDSPGGGKEAASLEELAKQSMLGESTTFGTEVSPELAADVAKDPLLEKKRKTSIRIGPDDDPNVLERILLGKALKGKDISKKRDLITLAGYSPFEYDLFQDQLKQKTAPKISERSNVYSPDGKIYQAVKITSGNRTFYSLLDDEGNPTMRTMPSDYTATPPDKPDIEANVLQLNADQFNAANAELGLNYPKNSVVKLTLKKGFNPEGKTIQELYENATSIDFKEPKKPDTQNIYTGDFPKTLNDSLRVNIQNSISVIGQGASLIEKIATIPDAVGIKGRFIRSIAGVAGLIDSVARTDLENALTQYWADADPEELSRVTADIRQYVAKSISTITGEESGRYTQAEQDLAKRTIAAEADLGTPKAVYGALISILSIEERSRDRATTALARNKARISGEPIEYANPLLNDEQKISYMKYLQKLGFDKKSAINVIEGIELDREIAERGGI